MAEVGTAVSTESAYAGIKAMLGNLGDPFTRFATPKVSADCITQDVSIPVFRQTGLCEVRN